MVRFARVENAASCRVVLTGLTMKGFPYFYQDTAKGLVLLLALIFSYTISRKKVRYTPAT